MDNTTQTENNSNQWIVDHLEAMSQSTDQALTQINLSLKGMAGPDGFRISQSSLQDLASYIKDEIDNDGVNRRRSFRRDVYEERRNATSENRQRRNRNQDYDFDVLDDLGLGRNNKSNRRRRRGGNIFDQITDAIEDEFTKSLFGSAHPVRDVLNKSIVDMAHKLGTDVDGLGDEIGSRIGKIVGDSFKGSRLGNRLTREWQGIADRLTNHASNFMDRVGDRLSEVDMSGTIRESTVRAQQEYERQMEHDEAQRAARPNTRRGTVNDQYYEPIDAEYRVVEDEGTHSNSNQGGIADIADTIRGARNIADNLPKVMDALQNGPEGILNSVGEILNSSANSLASSAEGTSAAFGETASAASTAGTSMTAAGESAGALSGAAGSAGTSLTATGQGATAAAEGAGALGGAATGAAAAIPVATVAIVALALAADYVSNCLKSVGDGIKSFGKGLKSSSNRILSQNAKNLELWKERVKADNQTIIEAAFDVIKDSANKIQQTWDNILTTVTATQGYTKASVQDLWSVYAQRLSDEGLSSVVSSADIMENLSNVLKSGLSGAVAEEFAYQATQLNAAVPTEDFFQYASTYASLAANAIKQGYSQEEAIQMATNELRTFASNLLYARREIAGGFTTSLTNASDLFEKSAEIALTSRTGDVGQISGVLTSVSATVGSIAPDLANSIVDAVVQAAVGGNSSSITALRSLAGTGASNTAFLQALAKDPQKVFSTLFENLAQLQQMSSSNYMEVAEALSETFGMSMNSFARVDFEYLAQQIRNMNVSWEAISDNMSVLASGQTTSTESQVRMQKINEYMVDEGLAYVLDNEVARSIQEHMWQEQLARELEETTYSVELTGGTLDLINGIHEFVYKIAHPVKTLTGLSLKDMNMETQKAAALNQDVTNALKQGVVGTGNFEEYLNLTAKNQYLNVTGGNYLDLMGTRSAYAQARDISRAYIKSQNDKIASSGWDFGGQFLVNGGNVNANGSSKSFAGLDANSSIADWIGDASARLRNAVNDAISSSAAKTKDNSILSSISKTAVEQNRKQYTVGQTVARGYKHTIASKSSIPNYVDSGDYRTDASYSAIWNQGEALSVVKEGQDFSKDLQDSLTNYISTNLEDKLVETASIGNIKESLSNYNKAFDTLSESQKIAVSNASAAQEAEHRSFLSHESLLNMTQTFSELDQTSFSFEDWVDKFEQNWNSEQKALQKSQGLIINDSQYRNKTLQEILSDYGTDISQIEHIFNAQQSLKESAQTKARELHEVQFWEDMQNFATKDFPWYMREWERYYIQHEAYGLTTQGAYVDENGKVVDTAGLTWGEQANSSAGIGRLFMAQEEGQGDAVLNLARLLTENSTYQNKTLEQLRDPQLQTNAILSKILLIVEAIMQQNNETSVVSVPTSLVSLGLGVSNI